LQGGEEKEIENRRLDEWGNKGDRVRWIMVENIGTLPQHPRHQWQWKVLPVKRGEFKGRPGHEYPWC